MIELILLQLTIAGKKVEIRPLYWHADTTIRVLPDGTKQESHHKAVVIVNDRYVAFI